MRSPMQIEVRNLAKLYDPKRGLAPTSFNVEQGDLIGVVGHNGAGKSTLLKLLSSWILPQSGTVRIDGIDLKNRTAIVKKSGLFRKYPIFLTYFQSSTTSNSSPRCLGLPCSGWKKF